MKKTIILAWLCLALFPMSSYCQVGIDSIVVDANGRTYQQIFDSLTQNLNKNKIKTGLLYNRVHPYTNLHLWESGQTTSASDLIQSWWDIEHSYLNQETAPIAYKEMRDKLLLDRIQLRVPILAVAADFNYFHPDAIQSGAITLKKGLFEDGNPNLPAYAQNSVRLAGLGFDEVIEGKTYLLNYDERLVFNNTAHPIDSIQLENTDTKERWVLTEGQEVPIVFKKKRGIADVKFTSTVYSNSMTYVSKQVIKIRGGLYKTTSSQICAPSNEIVSSDIPFQGYDEAEASNSYADYHIYYHYKNGSTTECERSLKKPIIILDGFDPLDLKRSYSTFYDDFFVDYSTKGSSQLFNVGDDFRKKGYDVIILNFPTLGAVILGESGANYAVPDVLIPSHVYKNGGNTLINKAGRDGGADYVERNAMVLVKLIQQFNDSLAINNPGEELIIIGPSMGGQISRYALAYMEKQQALNVPKMDHNTRLWISFDSPHLGANISLPMQDNVHFFGVQMGQQAAADSYNDKLRSKTARQFLWEQRDGQNGITNHYQTYFNNHLINNGLPGSDGWPQNLRKIALVNGSGFGNSTHNEYEQMLEANAYITQLKLCKKCTVFPFPKTDVFRMKNWLMPEFGAGAKKTFSGRFTNQSTAIPIICNQSTFRDNVNPRGCMDIVPGGLYNTPRDIYNPTNDTLVQRLQNDEIQGYKWSQFKSWHSFIPTVSGLGFKNGNINWAQRLDDRNLVCTGEIYFDNYFHPEQNEQHSSLWPESIAWLAEEVEYGAQGCPIICSHELIGPDKVCPSTPTIYSLDQAIPNAAVMHWTVGPNLQIVSSNNNSVTVQPIASSSSNKSWIKARITPRIGSQKCGADKIVLKTDIQAGEEDFDLNFVQIGGNGCDYEAEATPYIPNYTYAWSNNGANYYNGTKHHGYYLPMNNANVPVWLKVTTGCGVSVFQKNFTVQSPPPGCMWKKDRTQELTEVYDLLEVFPNPSKGDWELLVHTYQDRHLQLSFIDVQGKVRWKNNLPYLQGSKVIIPSENLSAGIYMLQAILDGKVYTFKLVKE